jgi:FAD/FMN-containing dehydrogenase
MDKAQAMHSFVAKRDQLKLEPRTGKIRLKKRTISNLFRYAPRDRAGAGLSLSDFVNVIGIDTENKTLDVEGLATYERVVDFTLARGLLPLVTPELKHITVGGATVGIGIESTGFRYGFVHDGLIEAEVLLPDGRIVLCNGNDSHTDLFHALPNSYGTLGYILRAKIRLLSAKRHVHIRTSAFSGLDEYLEAMRLATENVDNDFVEGLFFSADRFPLRSGLVLEYPGIDALSDFPKIRPAAPKEFWVLYEVLRMGADLGTVSSLAAEKRQRTPDSRLAGALGKYPRTGQVCFRER